MCKKKGDSGNRQLETCGRWQTRRMERRGGNIVEFQARVSGHEATEMVSRIQIASLRLVARRQIRNRKTHPTFTWLLVEWATQPEFESTGW